MSSPSSSTIRRSTPWVLGCCGPIFKITVSRVSTRGENRCFNSSTVVSSSWCSASAAITHPRVRSSTGCPYALILGVGLLFFDLVEVESELHFLVAQGVILAQRVSLPISRHHDPPQIGATADFAAEHV